jgi:WD40 repeat protein
VNTVSFSPDGLRIVSCSSDGTARVWDISQNISKELISGRQITHIAHQSRVSAIAFSLNGQQIASVDMEGSVRVWEAGTGFEVANLVQGGYVMDVAFSPDGQWMIAAGCAEY